MDATGRTIVNVTGPPGTATTSTRRGSAGLTTIPSWYAKASGMEAGVESPAARPWQAAPEDHTLFRCGHLSSPFLADPFLVTRREALNPGFALPLRVLGIARCFGLTAGAKFALG